MPDFTVRGDPAAIRERASTTADKGRLFFDTGEALARIDTQGWTGRAADHFREAHDLEPQRWLDAGNGFVRAGNALTVYAGELEHAQAVARWAEGEHARGEEVTAAARAVYDADVSRARDQAAASLAHGIAVDLRISPFVDPGEEIRRHALAELASARSRLEAAAATCAGEVRAGCAAAPEEPGWLESGLRFVGGVLEGAGEAVWDLLTISPFGVVSMVQDATKLATGDLTPEELMAKYRLTLETAQGMLDALREDPVEFGKQLGKGLLDWDTWADDPARAIGHLVPDAIAAAATAGAGAVATRGANAAADGLDALSDLGRVDRLDDLGDLGRLDDLDDLGDLGRLGRADDVLSRYDDLPPPPQGTFRGLDDPALDPWLDEVVGRHPELSRDGVRGIWDYTTDDGYRQMNGELRQPGSVTDPPAVRDRIDAAERGLAQLPPYDGTTFGGSNLPDHVVDQVERTGTYRDPGFSSSTLDPRVAEQFYDPHGPNPTRFVIEGSTGVDVRPFSAAQGEAEILFRGGVEFEVVRNEVGPDGVRVLELRERP
ncbi:putative T7SS-secreted protein [Nocardioides sp. SYSU DS0663]|uniref:putative T7SS-secreted protein n=1 Tax=Nocardioides sp. SYSU DS0663 TaxID=3416445 RepID=UPI003F4C8C69